MAKQMTPAQMKAKFLEWKVDLNLYPGWETRGYGPGSISDVEGVLIHHTGSDAQSDSYLDFLFKIGRPGDVPPPLANWATDMDGDLWLGAAERANHAGAGSSATLAKVESGNYDWRNKEITPGPDNINGNARYYGNEVRFDGGQPMTRAQWVTVILSSAAVCDFHGWGAWRVIGHKEHTARKPDPGSTLMYMIRRDVDAALKAGPGNWPTPPKEWDEMATKEEIAEVTYDSAYKANKQYGIDFWVAPTGTGTQIRRDLAALDLELSSLRASLSQIVWGTQIADVFTPEVDTAAASTLLTYGSVRAGDRAADQVMAEVEPVLASLQAQLVTLTAAVEALAPEDPPQA